MEKTVTIPLYEYENLLKKATSQAKEELWQTENESKDLDREHVRLDKLLYERCKFRRLQEEQGEPYTEIMQINDLKAEREFIISKLSSIDAHNRYLLAVIRNRPYAEISNRDEQARYYEKIISDLQLSLIEKNRVENDL